MSNIFFTSDTHFGAERTLKFSKRPFKTVEEMDEALIKNWNDTVGKDDIVYHLGDFGDYSVAKKLNGKIRLICGNYEEKEIDLVNNYAHCFDNISTEIKMQWINHKNVNYLVRMAHKPSDLEKFQLSVNEINIFGHVHRLSMIKRYGLNVGCDCHFFTPIDMDYILHYHNAIINYYDYDVFS